MKQILVIAGSPRKGANSDCLANTVSEAVRHAGAEAKQIWIRDMTFGGCVVCDSCKGETFGCVQKDDFTALLDTIRNCDGMVLVSPIYFEGIPGNFKNYIDRHYCLFNPAAKEPVVPVKNRRLGVIFTFGGEHPEYERVAGSLFTSMKMLGLATEHQYLATNGNFAPDSVSKKEDILNKAREIGRWAAEA
jgi:multimeric flavodoxin WrbA